MMVPEGPNVYSSKLSSLLGSSGAPCPNEEHFAPLERNRSFLFWGYKHLAALQPY